MDREHEYRAKNVWESKFIQILYLPPWLKNSFKVGLSTQEKFRIAQNRIRKNLESQKPAKKLDSQNLSNLS